MPTFVNLTALGCAAAICLGAGILGFSGRTTDDVVVSVNAAAASAPLPQIENVAQREDATVEARGSLYYWRASNARRSGRREQGAFVMPVRETRPVTDERLAYERELFSREVKDNMLVAKTPTEVNRRVVDAHATVTPRSKAHEGKSVDASDAAINTMRKPKKKRAVRVRRDAPVMAFSSPFDRPFGIW